MRRSRLAPWLVGSLVATVGILTPAPAIGTEGAAAQLVRLRLPIAGDDDAVFTQRLERAADRLQAGASEAQRPRLVIQIEPSEEPRATAFERALGVARFLVSDRMSGVRTIAYLPESLTGHAVLVALACEEIALAPDAEFGAATADEDAARGLEPGVLAVYQQIAETRRTVPAAVVAAMLDRDVELVRLETEDGVRFAQRDEIEALAESTVIAGQEVLSPAGVLAQFTGREARAEGFVQYLAKDRASLARSLGLGAGGLLVDQTLDEPWRPVMIDVAGPLKRGLVRRVETLLADELADGGANWVGLRIDSSGGDPVAGLRLAQVVAELNPDEVRTVAYVPRQAEGPAALVALACDQLVMQVDATLRGEAASGDADVVVLNGDREAAADNEDERDGDGDDDGPDDQQVGDDEEAGGEGGANGEADGEANDGADDGANDPLPIGDPPRPPVVSRDVEPIVSTLRESLGELTGRPWSLLAATVDPRIEVIRYTHRETGELRDMSPAERDEQAEPDAWQAGETIVAADEALSLASGRATRLGIAWREIDQVDELTTLYGFESLPRTAEPNWALELVEALASPGLAALLLVVGVVGLYIELSTPGLGIGGFIAAIAFLLFFWSKFLDGTADWLEALLFVAGVVFVLIEVMVLPGFGVFGLGGGLMILAALVLAGQTFLFPKTPSQLDELRQSLGAVAGAGVGCLVIGLVLRQYLPHSPLFRRATLMPPEEADRIEQDRRETIVDYSHLVGVRGVAAGDLLPSGRAEIDGELIDVISQGEPIDRRDPIEVVSARGSRVVVRRVAV